MEIELTKGSSRASGSQLDDSESVGLRRNLEKTAGWSKSVAQHSGPSQPLSPNVVIHPTKKVKEDRRAYPKTTPLFKPGASLFSAQLQDSSILKKPEIRKTIRVTEPQTFLPKTTFQQQGPSAFQNKQKSQSPKHNSRNRPMESQIQTTVIQATPQVIYQPCGDPRGLPKLKLTEISGNPLEWPDWAELFDCIMHQKRLSDIEKMQYLKISLTGQAKPTISGLDFSSKAYYQAWDVLCRKFGRPRVIVEPQIRKIYTHPTDTMIPVASLDFQT